MAFDIVAFYESLTGSATFDNVAGLADSHVTVSGDNITMPWIIEKGSPSPPKIMFAMATTTNASDLISACQLTAPSMGQRTSLDLPVLNQVYALTAGPTSAMSPNTASTAYVFSPGQSPISWFVNSPITLVPGEALSCRMISTGTTAACLDTCVVGIGNGNTANPYPMPIETVRFTAAQTLTAHAWTNAALTTTQTYQYGRHAVVGMKYFGATAQAARLVMPETPHRPGCIGVTGRGDHIAMFENGNMGVYGEFTSTALPTVDYLANAADTAQVVYLQTVKIA